MIVSKKIIKPINKIVQTEYGRISTSYFQPYQDYYKNIILSNSNEVSQVNEATNIFLNLITSKKYESAPIFRSYLIKNICFTNDATVRPTVGQVIRTNYTKPNIRNYFMSYFSQSTIPDLEVMNKLYKPEKLTNNLYLNLCYIKFMTDQSENINITANMTFLFNRDIEYGWKIRLLHSSPLIDNIPKQLITSGDSFGKIDGGWKL